MSLWRSVLQALADRLPARRIDAEPENGDKHGIWSPLFYRHFVCRSRRALVTSYLHHYLRSDPDRGPHNHPWGWAIAIPLAGGYVEERLVGFDQNGPVVVRRRRRPFVPYRLTGWDCHRVLIPPGAPSSWSLFVHGPNCKGWGFLRHEGSIDTPDRMAIPYMTFNPMKASGDDAPWWLSAPRGRDLRPLASFPPRERKPRIFV